MIENRRMLPIAEAAKVLGTTTEALRKKARRRTIYAQMVGSRWLIEVPGESRAVVKQDAAPDTKRDVPDADGPDAMVAALALLGAERARSAALESVIRELAERVGRAEGELAARPGELARAERRGRSWSTLWRRWLLG